MAADVALAVAASGPCCELAGLGMTEMTRLGTAVAH